MAEALMKYETIGEEQLKDIMAGRSPKPPPDWDQPLAPLTPKAAPEPPGVLGSPAGQH